VGAELLYAGLVLRRLQVQEVEGSSGCIKQLLWWLDSPHGDLCAL
jgi:hypothetical protein